MTVHLVGAGPGDPELISVRGARLLASADVVLHDRLTTPLVALAPAGAEVVDVGKAPHVAPVPQEEINRLLVEHGMRRGCVVRLKGGDPFVFGRGSEEAAALRAAGVDFTVVPGISSVLAAPAAAGVPLTCRGVAQSFTVVTGHEDPDTWPAGHAESLATLGTLAGTIVVLMGSANMVRIAERLVAAGLAAGTPVVAARAVTTGAQEIRRATLGTIGDALLDAPSTFVIGNVAGIDFFG